ncbi:MAG: AI-2E family transporter [Candidatus Competibacteraceae bacterium]|nr:MAG: AI-2E family transporter [Candidatus Competibacteraceae bacterium]
MKIISDWFRRLFNDPQAIILTIMLALGISVVLIMGRDLAPVLASMVIAYLLEGVVQLLQRRLHLPRWLAVVVVFVLFIAFVLFLLFGLLPLASQQLTQLVQQLPNMIVKGQNLLLSLPALYPEFITEAQVLEVINAIRAEIATWGQKALSWSLAAGIGFITVIVYLVLAPLLVFFFLKDKELILDWLHGFLPRDHTLGQQVWREVDRQMGNYVRGKFMEIMVVWIATFIAFTTMGLQFAMLLALMVGLSVIVPYIGAVVVTVPVALVAFFQWGWSSEFLWLLGVYLIIQGLDGNLLVPLLFSEVVDLHPIAIIVAVLVFGGLWGFWGVFFAIPLATVVQSILKAWPRPVPVAEP